MSQSANHCSRRGFLQSAMAGSAVVSFGGAVPQFLRGAGAWDAVASDRVLVVIQLTGGNDGLNTVIPFRDPEYRKARPELAISQSDQIKLSDDIGLHPSLRGVADLFDSGEMAIVQGVGYPSPNRSHFESMDIWHSCQRKDVKEREGWLGRFLSLTQKKSDTDFAGLHYGAEQQPAAMIARGLQIPSVSSIDQFRLKVGDNPAVLQSVQALAKYELATPEAATDDLLGFVQTSAGAALESSERLDAATKSNEDKSEFPTTQLGEKMRVIARLISAGLAARVYYMTLDGFDTHAQQAAAHAGLLQQWSDALAAFMKQLEARGQADRVTVMTFSEFGRRVAENASDGTDHGAAAPLFLTGKSINSGIIGKYPSLTDLDDGDLKFHTDFRRVYATVLQDWFGTPATPILGSDYKTLPLFSV